MTKFVVTQVYNVLPEALARWWLDYGPDDVKLESSLKSRKVEKLDQTHTHLINDMTRGKRIIHLDGIVTVGGPTRWSYSCDIAVDGKPFAKELSTFHVVPAGPGKCSLHAEFKWVPVSFLARIALPFLKASLRREREEAYAGYAPSVEAESKDQASQ